MRLSLLEHVLKKPNANREASPPETEVQSAIRRGDAARARREWDVAAREYRAALSKEDHLSHIWVQMGHALKEQGKLESASNAYQQAIVLEPQDVDAHVHLAHVFKKLGWLELAIDHLLRAFHFGLDSRAEERELEHLLALEVAKGNYARIESAVHALDRLPRSAAEAPLLQQLRQILAKPDRSPADEGARIDGPAMIFDISDLIGFWRRARLPTGIQRVQIEAILGALSRENGRSVRLCCFTEGREEWLEVNTDLFCRLCGLATAGGKLDDREWVEAVTDLNLHLALSQPFDFPEGALLINLGTSWWLQNYFLFVRHASASKGVRYIPFVHDMIPIVAPEHCTSGLTQDFISWALGVFDHADHFLVNSKATREDLRKVAATLGHAIAPEDVAIIPLDSDFRKEGHVDLPDSALADWQLENQEFVLFVSTIESRKGHLLAFEAWSRLICRHGAERIPQLVCVGNGGWLNSRVYERLATDFELSRKVTMLSGLSDAELALLYRNCRFTIYPSLYEGWGLPVTESLCYGKVPLISDAASLPEAGGSLAVYAKAGSIEELTGQAERLILDDQHRRALEHRILEEFAPRSWSQLAGQIVEELERFAARSEGAKKAGPAVSHAPMAHVGCWHSLGRNRFPRIWPGMSTGEKYRSGLGWFWPEERGCRVRGSGGELHMRIDRQHEGLRMYFGLRGDENERCHYVITCGDARVEGEIAPDAVMWAWLNIPASGSDQECMVKLSARPTHEGGLPTYFLRGFYLCECDDARSRQDFLEAVTLGRMDLLDAFRERDTAEIRTGISSFGGMGTSG